MPMTNINYCNLPAFMGYFIDDPVITGPDPIQRFGTAHFSCPMWDWCFRKGLDLFENPWNNIIWEACDIFLRTCLDKDLIEAH
nr:hypothetical protein [Methanofollis formosanus]